MQRRGVVTETAAIDGQVGVGTDKTVKYLSLQYKYGAGAAHKDIPHILSPLPTAD
jgi:hypothetical protein